MQANLPLSSAGPASEDDTRFVLDYPESELVFGVVYATGTDYKPVLDYLTDHIKLSGYVAHSLHISDWFGEGAERLGFMHALPDEPEYDRIASRIDAGNKIRAKTRRQDK